MNSIDHNNHVVKSALTSTMHVLILLHGTVSVAISLDVGGDTFSVTCAATGGTAIASSFTGPGVTSDLQPVGTIHCKKKSVLCTPHRV